MYVCMYIHTFTEWGWVVRGEVDCHMISLRYVSGAKDQTLQCVCGIVSGSHSNCVCLLCSGQACCQW